MSCSDKLTRCDLRGISAISHQEAPWNFHAHEAHAISRALAPPHSDHDSGSEIASERKLNTAYAGIASALEEPEFDTATVCTEGFSREVELGSSTESRER